MFGYNRQLLLRALPGTEEAPGPERKEMQKAKFCLDEKTRKTTAKNVMDYALFTMLRKNLIFSDGYKAIDENGTLVTYQTSSSVNLVSDVRIKRSKQGTTYAIRVHRLFGNNCSGGHYTSFRLSDYLNIKTPGGIAWEAGRRLYLRLVWKLARIAYQETKPKKERAKDYRNEDYRILKEAAGLNYSLEKKNAAALRKMLDQVVQLTGLHEVPTLELATGYGEQPYQVKIKKQKVAATSV
jgi:hypothetical protein